MSEACVSVCVCVCVCVWTWTCHSRITPALNAKEHVVSFVRAMQLNFLGSCLGGSYVGSEACTGPSEGQLLYPDRSIVLQPSHIRRHVLLPWPKACMLVNDCPAVTSQHTMQVNDEATIT